MESGPDGISCIGLTCMRTLFCIRGLYARYIADGAPRSIHIYDSYILVLEWTDSFHGVECKRQEVLLRFL